MNDLVVRYQLYHLEWEIFCDEIPSRNLQTIIRDHFRDINCCTVLVYCTFSIYFIISFTQCSTNIMNIRNRFLVQVLYIWRNLLSPSSCTHYIIEIYQLSKTTPLFMGGMETFWVKAWTPGNRNNLSSVYLFRWSTWLPSVILLKLTTLV